MYDGVMQAEKRVLIAIDSTLKEPYISITRHGPIATWANILHKNIEVMIYYCSKPNRLMIFLDYWIEDLRWKKGRKTSYTISYFLMWIMWPLRWYIPNICINIFFWNKKHNWTIYSYY